MENICSNCKHFEVGNEFVGTCLRYPRIETKRPGDRCGEFSYCSVNTEQRKIDVITAGWFERATKAAIKRNKVRLLGQLMDLGRTAIKLPNNGGLDHSAIQEISVRMAREGIVW